MWRIITTFGFLFILLLINFGARYYPVKYFHRYNSKRSIFTCAYLPHYRLSHSLPHIKIPILYLLFFRNCIFAASFAVSEANHTPLSSPASNPCCCRIQNWRPNVFASVAIEGAAAMSVCLWLLFCLFIDYLLEYTQRLWWSCVWMYEDGK